MAVGDVVSGVFNTVTVMSFQPAVGVEICLTTIAVYSKSAQLTDGTITALIGDGNLIEGINGSLTKTFINNTIYLSGNVASPLGSAFTGIQIQ